MKIIAETPEEQKLLDRIKRTSDEMATQDNLATSFPVWYVTEEFPTGDLSDPDNDDLGSERRYTSYGSCFFLTQKACQNYINANDYHFDRPLPYAGSAHRNDEIQSIIHFILLAGGNEIPSNHYGRLR